MNDAKSMMDDDDMDREMREMAESEYYELKEQLPKLEKEIKILLLPKNEEDEKNAILKYAPVPAAMRRLCLRRFCLKCISAIRKNRAGSLKFSMPTKTGWEDIKKLRPKLPAKMFSPS